MESTATLTDLSTEAIRPRFQWALPVPPAMISSQIERALHQPDAPCLGRLQDGYGQLILRPEEQHFWSPQVSLTLEEIPEGTELRGVYGPRPSLWLMFVFFYSLIGFAATLIAVIGGSRLLLDQSAMILWGLPGLTLLFLSLYLVAYLGKRKGAHQMKTLHDFLRHSLPPSEPSIIP